MERNRSVRHGGNHGGGPAHPPARHQLSQTPIQNSASEAGAHASSVHRGSNGGGSTVSHNSQRTSPAPTPSAVHDINERVSHFLKQRSIHKKIDEATYNRGSYGNDFIPHAMLRHIWRHDLKEFLTVLGRPPVDDVLTHIWKSLLRILSILVVIRWREWHRFSLIFLEPVRDRQRPRQDESIPFTLVELSDNSFLGEMGNDFNLRQHAFNPILIEGGKPNEHPKWTRVPFIKSETEELGRGNYGIVTKEAIAPYQFKSKRGNIDSNIIYVARKEMTVQSDFRREKDNLVELNSSLSNHGHIVRYIAIIIIGDNESAKQFSILMPLATMNLQTLLYTDDSSLPNFEIKDLLRQAANVANAIKWLHEGQPIKGRRLVCCHMDLKLDNVLVYLDQGDEGEPIGKWKIADFGISTLKEPDEQRAEQRHRSEAFPVESPAHTLARLTARMPAARAPAAFQAPEVFRGSEVGRSSDVWSFGCILFQILARGVGPNTQKLHELDGLRAFEKDRVTRHETDYFFHERGSMKYLNPHVKDWLQEGLPNGSYYDRYFVKSCKSVISKMLIIDATDRLKADQVDGRLWTILKGPAEARFSEVQTTSNTHQRSLTVPGISITSAREHDYPHANPQTNLVPASTISATLNGPFDSPFPMQASFINPRPENHRSAARSTTVDRQGVDGTQPSIHNVNTASEFRSRQELPLHSVRGSQGQPGPQATSNAPIASRNPHSPPISFPSVGGTIPARAFENTPNRPQPYNQDYIGAQSQVSSSPKSNTTQEAAGRASTSQSSNRSNSLVSSVDSRASIEAVSYDTKHFGKLKDTVLQAMISSTSGNIAFITKKAIFIRNTSGKASYFTIGTENFEWECGSMAGDWLVSVGYNTAVKSNKERVFRLYKVSTNGVLEPPHSYRIAEPISHVDHAVVSWEGRLIFQDRPCAWLYSYYSDNGKKPLSLKPSDQPLSQFGKPQGINFGNNGAYAFVKASMATNYFRIGVWNVDEPRTLFTYYDYQRERQDLTAPIPNIIPFPLSPFCILWDENGKVWFLRQKGLVANQPAIQKDNLQAMAISPCENYVVFIRSIKRKSEISVSRLHSENEGFKLEEKCSGIKLNQSLSHPKKSAVEMQATAVGIRVLIAHCDGTYEIEEIRTVEWT